MAMGRLAQQQGRNQFGATKCRGQRLWCGPPTLVSCLGRWEASEYRALGLNSQVPVEACGQCGARNLILCRITYGCHPEYETPMNDIGLASKPKRTDNGHTRWNYRCR